MYAVTGASGKFGRLAIEGLLDAGTDPSQIVALVRTPARVADLGDRGVIVRAADYDEPDTLVTGLDGVDDLLFVSASEAGRRIPQHQAVVDAAVSAGVTRVVYTSILRADTSPIALAAEHKATEEALTTGTTVVVKDVSGAEYTDILVGFGLDPGTAAS